MPENKIKGMLSEFHKKPEWVFWTELKNAKVHKDFRRIDAFAISKKNFVIAYEIKTSKVKVHVNYTRRSFFIDNSNEFYLVTPPGLLNYFEVPKDCGWMEAGETLIIKKKAPQRPITTLPIAFVAEMFHREDERCVQDWPIFNLVGKKLTGNELLQFIQAGIEKYRSTELERLKKEIDEKYLIGLELRDKKQRSRVKSLVKKLMEVTETL